MPSKYSEVKTPEGKVRRYLREDAQVMKLVDKGYKMLQQLEELKAKVKENKEQLIALAKGKLSSAEGQTVHLDSLVNRCTVSFPKTTSYDHEKLNQAKGMLASIETDEDFDLMFTTKVTYAPRKELDAFLKSEATDELLKVQHMINSAAKVKPGSPTLRIRPLEKEVEKRDSRKKSA